MNTTNRFMFLRANVLSLRLLLFVSVWVGFRSLDAQVADQSTPSLAFIFNQPRYTAGDTVYFKAFITRRPSALFAGTRAMNISLFKGNQQVVFQRLLMRDGVASGSMFLDSRMINGVHVLQMEVGGHYYESEFTLASDKKFNNESSKATMAEFSVNTDFGNGPYLINQEITFRIKVDNAEILTNPTFTASIVKADLFDSQNFLLCKQTGVSEQLAPGDGFPGYFSGRVVDYEDKKVPDSTKITCYLRASDFIFPVYTHHDGEFKFPLFKEFGSDEVFYKVSYHGRPKPNYSVIIDEKFRLPSIAISTEESSADEAYWSFAQRRATIQSSYGFFLHPESKQMGTDWNDFSADYEVDLDVFESFPSVSELIVNIVPTVRHRKSTRGESVRIFMKENAQVASADPTYIIDGVMTDSTDLFLQLDPTKIKTIKILRSRENLRRFGELGENGIIIVTTKVRGGLKFPPSKNMHHVAGINPPALFSNLSNASNSRIVPDVRSCLYWNPKLEFDRDGATSITFQTGEVTGPIKLITTWVSDEGNIVSREKLGEIQFMPK